MAEWLLPVDAMQVGRWGSIKKVAAAADGTLWLSYKRGLLEQYAEGGKLLWSSCSGNAGQPRPGQPLHGAAGSSGAAGFKPAGWLFGDAAALHVDLGLIREVFPPSGPGSLEASGCLWILACHVF